MSSLALLNIEDVHIKMEMYDFSGRIVRWFSSRLAWLHYQESVIPGTENQLPLSKNTLSRFHPYGIAPVPSLVSDTGLAPEGMRIFNHYYKCPQKADNNWSLIFTSGVLILHSEEGKKQRPPYSGLKQSWIHVLAWPRRTASPKCKISRSSWTKWKGLAMWWKESTSNVYWV